MFGMRSSLYMVAGSSAPVAGVAAPVVQRQSSARSVVQKQSSAWPVVQKQSGTWPVAHQPSATYPTLPGRYPEPASPSNTDKSAE